MLRPRWVPGCRQSVVMALLCGNAALAQTNSLEQAQNQNLEAVIVVGSRLPQTQAQALPVTVITNEQMLQRGFTTVQQALDGVQQNSGGGFDQQLGFSFAPSAAGLNLRDLGVNRSLVLLDGKRLPMFPIGWNGTDSFVDITAIPMSAVARIEILADGASAIYGSDALSGVVNIVLKRRADNEASMLYGDTTGGGGAQRRVQLSLGTQMDEANASLFIEYYQQMPLWNYQRKRTRSDRLGGVNGPGPGNFSLYGYPGTFYTGDDDRIACDASSGSPGLDADGFCLFNNARYRQVRPEIRSVSVTAKFEQPIQQDLSWHALLNLRNARTTATKEPLDFDSYYDLGIILPGSLSNNPVQKDAFVLRRMMELGPQVAEYDNLAYNAFAGLDGKLAGFNWQLNFQAAKLMLEKTDYGWARSDRLAAALLGDIDFNGDGVGDPLPLVPSIPASAVPFFAYTPVSLSQATLNGMDAQLSGELFRMPAGSAQFALVAEYAWEKYFDHPDAQLVARNVTYYSATPAEGRRSRSGLGLEVELPLLRNVQLNLAGRYDNYHDASDVGGAFSPRLELKYQPGSAWSLHGSTGKSFRAPDMQRLFGGASSAYINVINTPQCLRDGGSGRGDASVSSCVNPVVVGITRPASLALQEERGTHYRVGSRFTPTPQWLMSLDYFSIDLRDVVQTLDGQFVLDQNALNGNFAGQISSGGNCPTSICLLLPPRNIAYKKVSGLDGAVRHDVGTGLGKFSIQVNASYLLDLTMRESSTRPRVDVLRDGTLGEAARLKGNVDLGWERGAWGSNLYVDHIGGFAPFYSTTEKHLGSFTTLNYSLRYTLLSRAVAQVGVNNIFNRMPPVDLQRGNLSQPFYQQQFHNVDGASWYATLRQPF